MQYQLALTAYQGPLDKLLELIEARKLEITQVNLAEVTADFLAYLETLRAAILAAAPVTGNAPAPTNEEESSLLSDFLVIASKLVLIKSKAILPSLPLSEEEEHDVHDLEARLRVYQEFKAAQEHLMKLWNPMPVSVSREFLATIDPVFYPPAEVGTATLGESVARMIGELERLVRPTGTMHLDMANLKQKIEEVFTRLTSAPTSFSSLSTEKTRRDLVVLFLAILHLVKEQLVQVDQTDHFGDMVIAKTGTVGYHGENEAEQPTT